MAESAPGGGNRRVEQQTAAGQLDGSHADGCGDLTASQGLLLLKGPDLPFLYLRPCSWQPSHWKNLEYVVALTVDASTPLSRLQVAGTNGQRGQHAICSEAS